MRLGFARGGLEGGAGVTKALKGVEVRFCTPTRYVHSYRVT